MAEAKIGATSKLPEETTIEVKSTAALATQADTPMGFEDDEPGDMIIPRIKIIQTLSPERKSGEAKEGDIINSLTKDNYNGKAFVPVFKFNNNVWWRDRADGGGIQCMSRDGKTAEGSDGTLKICAQCRMCEFDNSKQGRDAVPKCIKYINFFGFFEGERMPVILSFGRTNYNEGKKLYSLAKVTMQNMWNFSYTMNDKLMAKSGNEWYIIEMKPNGATAEDDRAFAYQMFTTYRNTMQNMKYDMDESSGGTAESGPKVDMDSVEY